MRFLTRSGLLAVVNTAVISVRITRSDGNEKSTSMPSASRLKSSITFSVRMPRPSASWSCMKSITTLH